MWPIWVFDLMLLVAAILFLFLAWEFIRDVNAKIARWYHWWRTRRDHRHYLARHAQFLREGVR